MISPIVKGSYLTVLILALLSGAQITKASEMSKWIGDNDAFKETSICDTSEFKIVMPPYSTQNTVADGDTCGKVYIFTDSDSNERIAFAGAFIFDPLIDAQKYSAARHQLIEMLAKAGGGSDLHLKLSNLGSADLKGFLFEKIEMRSNGIPGPAGSMTWDVGIREFGKKTVFIFSGVTDLARHQDTLTEEEKISMNDLLGELSRWKIESLNLLVNRTKSP